MIRVSRRTLLAPGSQGLARAAARPRESRHALGQRRVGPLPPEIKITTSFAGAVSANSANPDAALALLKFLRSEEAIKVIRAQGMMPASSP
jgi:ABC-type Fe3+ transport system substrate-binding protein